MKVNDVTADTVIIRQPSIAPRFGFGGEFALGFRSVGSKFRPWLEVAVGTQYVSRAGLRFIRPSVLFGIEVGRLVGTN